MDIGAWWATLHRAAKSWTQLKWLNTHTRRTQSLSQSNVSLVTKLWNFSAKSTCIFMKGFEWCVHIYEGDWIGEWSIIGPSLQVPKLQLIEVMRVHSSRIFWLSSSRSDMSSSLRPHGLQHARLPCPSLSPGVCSNMDMSPLSHWCHPTVSSSVAPLLLLSVFPRIRIFSNESALRIRWPKYYSFRFSISPSNEYSGLISLRIDWFTLLAVQGTLKSLFQHHSLKINALALSLLYGITLKSIFNYWKKFDYTTLTMWIFIGKIMSLLFNTLFSFGVAFLPKSKCLLISWLQSASTVILEPKKIKSVTVSIISTSIYHEVIGPDAMILVFWMLTFKPAFSLSSFTFTKQLFSSSLASAIRVVSSAYLRLLIFLLAILIPAWA